MPKKRQFEVKKVPKGHFVVYVGRDLSRFVVPTSYLKNTLFQQLLQKSAEEFGFNSQNGIVIPCDESDFQQLTSFLDKCC